MKYLALLAIGFIAVALVGCGGTEAPPTAPSDSEQPSSADTTAESDAQVDSSLAEEDDVEIGEIV